MTAGGQPQLQDPSVFWKRQMEEGDARSAAFTVPAPWSKAQGHREGTGPGGTFPALPFCPLVNTSLEMSCNITKQIRDVPHSGERPREGMATEAGRWIADSLS